MSDTTSPAGEASAAASAKGSGSMLGRLVVALFLAAIILAECLAAYLYLPSASETQAAAAGTEVASKEGKEAGEGKESKEGKEKGGHHSAELPHLPEGEEGEAGQVEVDLEEFSVTAFQPSTNTSLRIDFHLYGTVGEKEAEEFRSLMEKNVHRFREQVIVIVRGAELNDLTDAGLGLIKRRILEKTNRILGKPLLKAVIVSDFSFIEQ